MEESPLRRIQFVTRHYAELRDGVKRAVIALFIVALTLTVGRPSRTFLAESLGLVAGAILLNWCMDRRFGRVVSRSNLHFLVMMAFGLTLLIAIRLDRLGLGAGRPSLAFIAATAYAVWVCIRLWPFAPHYFLPAVVAAGFAMLFRSVDTREEFLSWERYAYVSTLLAWMVAGSFDCALLMKFLPRRSSQPVTADAPEEHADAV